VKGKISAHGTLLLEPSFEASSFVESDMRLEHGPWNERPLPKKVPLPQSWERTNLVVRTVFKSLATKNVLNLADTREALRRRENVCGI
jgi:hypothetical protein